jgi:hypothetical protein
MAGRSKVAGRRALAAVLVVVAVCASLFTATIAVGCSGTTNPVPSSASLPPSSDSTIATADVVGADDLYARLAALADPIPIYAPTLLPVDARLADSWLPVIASVEPASYDGPRISNPHIVGVGEEVEIEVVYAVADGWLVVVENFLGDLGDVFGEEAGTVDGIPARLFSANGGELVQWSSGSRWYGVFGRGVARETLLETALSMKVVRPRSSE